MRGHRGVGGREGLQTPAQLPWERVTQRGEGMFVWVLCVLIPATSPPHLPTAVGGKQSLESGKRPPSRAGGAVTIGSTYLE